MCVCVCVSVCVCVGSLMGNFCFERTVTTLQHDIMSAGCNQLQDEGNQQNRQATKLNPEMQTSSSRSVSRLTLLRVPLFMSVNPIK